MAFPLTFDLQPKCVIANLQGVKQYLTYLSRSTFISVVALVYTKSRTSGDFAALVAANAVDVDVNAVRVL